MDKRPLTGAERTAVRLGQQKARNNERRRNVINYYTGNNKTPETYERKEKR